MLTRFITVISWLSFIGLIGVTCLTALRLHFDVVVRGNQYLLYDILQTLSLALACYGGIMILQYIVENKAHFSPWKRNISTQ